MKTYISEDGLKMTGKGWEIKRQLKTIVEQSGGSTTLYEYLVKRLSYLSKSNNGNGRNKREISDSIPAKVVPFPKTKN